MANPMNSNAILRRILAAFLFAPALAIFFGAASAAAQNPHGNIHDSWRVRCNTPTGAPAACQIFQNIIVKESGQPVLKIAIGFSEDGKTAVGIVVLPLGIFLPSGLTLQVDEGQVYEMAIEICGKNGCRVRFSFNDNLLNLFRRGNVARVTFFGGDRKPIRVPVSLKGFTAALKDVQ